MLLSSNSRLVLDAARARVFSRIGVPELVMEETCNVMERIYGRRVVFPTRTFLLRLCTPIPRSPRLREEMEKTKGIVPQKDLEVLAAARVMQADRLIAYDRHFQELAEYRTPKRMVEELGLRPYPTEY